MKQLVLQLESGGMPTAPNEPTPELQERLVVLMADALLAVGDDIPEQRDEEERTDSDE